MFYNGDDAVRSCFFLKNFLKSLMSMVRDISDDNSFLWIESILVPQALDHLPE